MSYLYEFMYKEIPFDDLQNSYIDFLIVKTTSNEIKLDLFVSNTIIRIESPISI